MTTTTTPSSFAFPREYSFPPFYTRQPNASTLHAQLRKWSQLIQSYCKATKTFKLSLTDALSTPLFNNSTLHRSLDLTFAREIIDFMRTEGRAEWIDGKSGEKNVCWIFWRNVEEWGEVIAGWVDDTGQKGTVLTLYEIGEGEATRDCEWAGMDNDLLKRVLQALVKRNKAQIFAGTGGDDGLGVKFF